MDRKKLKRVRKLREQVKSAPPKQEESIPISLALFGAAIAETINNPQPLPDKASNKIAKSGKGNKKD